MTVTAQGTAYVGVGLKLDCPNGKYVSVITGMGSPNLHYQVLTRAPDVHTPLAWPPIPGSADYGEQCPCDVCVGRLVGDTVAAIQAEANQIQGTMRVNQDTYQLRYLESARDVIVREAQLVGYGIMRGFDVHHNVAPTTETYLLASRRVSVRYDDASEEVKEVTVWLPVSTVAPPTYPGTLAGALTALRAAPQVSLQPPSGPS
jgi:hypothetical protein